MPSDTQILTIFEKFVKRYSKNKLMTLIVMVIVLRSLLYADP